ncbi:MAG TPA: DUF2235 domain-containing protein [Pseudomonadales bacterium]
MTKNILLFSDGTGNSAAKLFKTNVWRLYQAVDTKIPPREGQPLQIACYDDGIGTSSFKPLALLGGVFGVGLKRNVLELYEFVCRSYEPGDRIYAFGFSRGAFTIRVLVGLLTTIGLIDARGMDHAVLHELSADAYRKFRRSFRLSGNRPVVDPTGSQKRDRTELFVTRLRDFRDRLIAWKRRKAGRKTLDEVSTVPIPEIAFVGVWDTVAAYGSPIAEITKGIDRWIWPLSMPDYRLSEKVRVARHALALDDERDTFHPLLWDEVHERDLIADRKVSPERLEQVWFAGMHSDVGGGYADESLACVSLVWMAGEAMKAGLRLRDDALEDFRERADPFGPMHDSRSGVGAYYRYQPRKIAARLEAPDRTTRILQDPDMQGRGLLTEVRIHDSVVRRIQDGPDGYAPIVLPGDYAVEGEAHREHPEPFRAARAAAQETIWDLVWRRRVHYVATLALTLALVSLALFPQLWPYADSPCTGPQCFVSPWLGAVGEFLPSFASSWFDAFADNPGKFLVLTLLIALFIRATGKIELRMRDAMRRLFRLSFASPEQPTGNQAALRELKAIAAENGFIRRLRSGEPYQASLQYLKWRFAPGVAATAIYFASLVLVVTILSSVLSIVHRAQLVWFDRPETDCTSSNDRLGTDGAPARFSTSDMCWRVPDSDVEKGQRYRLSIDVVDAWVDRSPALATADSGSGLRAAVASLAARFLACFAEPAQVSIPASPVGFDSDRFRWCVRWPATILRRSTSDPWFRPLIYVQQEDGSLTDLRGVPMRLVDYGEEIYVGEFTAPADGKVILSVNDAVFLWAGRARRDFFYEDNAGTADVKVDSCMEQLEHPCEYLTP